MKTGGETTKSNNIDLKNCSCTYQSPKAVSCALAFPLLSVVLAVVPIFTHHTACLSHRTSHSASSTLPLLIPLREKDDRIHRSLQKRNTKTASHLIPLQTNARSSPRCSKAITENVALRLSRIRGGSRGDSRAGCPSGGDRGLVKDFNGAREPILNNTKARVHNATSNDFNARSRNLKSNAAAAPPSETRRPSSSRENLNRSSVGAGEMHSDPLMRLSQEQLTSYLLNRPRGPSLLMPHLPSRPENAHLLGGVQNVDDDQAYIEYWAEFRITRETTPKGINTFLLRWLPNAEYSQTEYFKGAETPFLSRSYVFEAASDLGMKWYMDAFSGTLTFRKLKSLWLRLDDLRESSYRIHERSGANYWECITAGFSRSGWGVNPDVLFGILNEIMFQTWRGYIHAQRAPQTFIAEYRQLLYETQNSVAATERTDVREQ